MGLFDFLSKDKKNENQQQQQQQQGQQQQQQQPQQQQQHQYVQSSPQPMQQQQQYQQQQPPRRKDCLRNLRDCLSPFIPFYYIGAGIGFVIAFAFLIVGIYYIATGTPSTTWKEYLNRKKTFDEQYASAFHSTTVSAPAGTFAVTTNESFQVNFRNGTGRTETYSSVIFRTTNGGRPTGSDYSVSYSMQMNGVASSFTTNEVDATRAGEPLSLACFAILQGSNRWAHDKDRKSCFYPFKSDSNRYASGAASVPVQVQARAQWDPFLYIQEQTEGTNVLEDKDLHLVDPNTPTMFGLFAFFAFASGAFLICTIILHCWHNSDVRQDQMYENAAV